MAQMLKKSWRAALMVACLAPFIFTSCIKDDLDGVLAEFDRTVGLSRLRAIHLNDSVFGLSSHKDRHAKISEGGLGAEAISRIINHPLLRRLPFYLETPNDLRGYAKEISLLRSLCAEEP